MYHHQNKDYSEDSGENVNKQEVFDEADSIINKTHLIVNYLPQGITNYDLYALFVTQGPIDYVRIMINCKFGYSFGYGFVKFQNAEDAARAIEALNGIEYYNKRLKVSYALPPSEEIKKSNLYVTNLPENITEDDVDKMFSEYGKIINMRLLMDNTTGMARGVAFIRYAKCYEAHNAIKNLNGKFLEGTNKPIYVKIAKERGGHSVNYYENQIKFGQMKNNF